MMISQETVKKLRMYTEMYPVCPEIEIGLGVPREPIRLVGKPQGIRGVQPGTQRDVTDELHTFANWFLKSLPPLDGFIMKDRSPSCGLKNTGIYPEPESTEPMGRGSGLFASDIIGQYPLLPRTDERDLVNFRLRDHFLTQIFTVAEFRSVRSHETTKNLLQFHAENKYLLLSYHRKQYEILTALVTNREERSFDVVMKEYHEHLLRALSRPPRVPSHLGVLHHALSHFKDATIPRKEREQFEEVLEAYRKGDKPLSAPRAVIRDWIVTYDEDYLSQQTYFQPYPSDLESNS
jgi:uncharacterized protein YbgA (DUF1722 family)/uncharacterized protein YbbK (DUF523 family)